MPRATFTDESGQTSYFHIQKDADFSDNAARNKVLVAFSEVFSNLAIRFLVPKEPEESGSPTYDLVDALRGLSCLHA